MPRLNRPPNVLARLAQFAAKQGNTMKLGTHSLISVAIALASASALAAGPDPGINVTVTNPASKPVPVTGTVNVGNLGATTLPVSVTNFPATQPVSVTNFPAIQSISGSVSVSNLPAVQSVTVTNTSSSPVSVRVLNAPGSNPFSKAVTSASPSFVVPPTVNGLTVQSLVVTQLSGGCTGIGSFLLPLHDDLGGIPVASFLFPVASLVNGFFPVTTQQTQIYFATGHSIVLGDNVPPHGCTLSLSGYYVTQ